MEQPNTKLFTAEYSIHKYIDAPAGVEALELVEALPHHGRVDTIEQVAAVCLLQHPGQRGVEPPPELNQGGKRGEWCVRVVRPIAKTYKDRSV